MTQKERAVESKTPLVLLHPVARIAVMTAKKGLEKAGVTKLKRQE